MGRQWFETLTLGDRNPTVGAEWSDGRGHRDDADAVPGPARIATQSALPAQGNTRSNGCRSNQS